MNEEFETELSAEERQAFDRLPREKIPPSLLEERVVQSLKQSGLISHTQNPRRWKSLRIGGAIAASLLFFFLGAAVTRWFFSPTSASTSNSPEYMLVLRQTGSSEQRSREEELRSAREYGAWARGLNQQGVLTDGEKLKDETRVLSVIDGRTVTSENPAEPGRSYIAGYFLIKARSYEEAIKVAESCPHLKAGGTVEVREIDRF